MVFRRRLDDSFFNLLISAWISFRLMPIILWASIAWKSDSDTQDYSCIGLVPKTSEYMPPGSAKTIEEGGKDGSMHVKILSPARFYNICFNYCVIHCTNLHILYRYPEKVFFQPESSSFSEANRLAKLTQQPNLPRRKTCTCKNKPLRFLCLYSWEAAVYHFSHSCLLNRPGASTGPTTNQAEGQPAQPVNLGQ